MERLEIPQTVIGFIKTFTKTRVVLTKIKSVSEHKHSQPMEIGTVINGTLQYMPKEGESFNIEDAWTNEWHGKHHSLWCTSIIVKFLPNGQFETKNSIYKYEIK